MARPALDKKTGKKQQQVGKKRGRPPKAKPLQAVTKPQKKESARTVSRKANKEKKEGKKNIKMMSLSPKKQAALGKDKKKNQVAEGEATAQEPVVSQAADPAEPKDTSSVGGYISGSWTYLSELVRKVRFGGRQ